MKRRWFQIHLSTAVVLMFVAGIIGGLNFWGREPRPSDLKILRFTMPRHEYLEASERHRHDTAFGWPFRFQFAYRISEDSFAVIEYGPVLKGPLALNVLIAFGILSSTGFSIEQIRRRKRDRLSAVTKDS